MSVQSWEHFFKPEVRTSGRALFAKGKVSVSQPSDTEIVIYVRATPGFKVTFKTESVESETLYVDCNCPVGKKDQLCKHVWAGLLATEDKNADFFESKTEIEKKESAATAKTTVAVKPTEKSEAMAAKQAAYKEKQDLYRKIQYQKQKLRQKQYKESRKNSPKKTEYPSDVERALSFFADNGIDVRNSLNQESIGTAKKKLARVFHPDIGGNHDEISELNKCADILMAYISRE